jgi:hypothetical protein
MNARAKIPVDVTACPDPGLVFLQRAAARLVLVEAGKMTIDGAIDGLIDHFEELVGPCNCVCDTVDQWECDYPPVRPRPVPVRRPTPQTTIEAILYCIRERGLAALKEPANVERLSRCDRVAKAEIDRRIELLRTR